MTQILIYFKKFVLVAVIAALGLAALPVTSAFALGAGDETKPPVDATQANDQQLENAWARLQRIYEREGNLMVRAEQFSSRIQNLIDRLNEKGFDTSGIQAALDAFEADLKDAHPTYEGAKGIINAHKGFDDTGRLTDRDLATETIQSLHDKMKEVRDTLGEPFKTLREAIKTFREANRPAGAPAAPDGSQAPHGSFQPQQGPGGFLGFAPAQP
jgi:DNA-binding transcriptional MerR regulator